MTKPYVTRRGYCTHCTEPLNSNHPRCAVALRDLGLGYCSECGGDIIDGLHDECTLMAAAKAGRPDLLEPPTVEELAQMERLTAALKAEIARIDQEGDDWRRQQAAPWN